MPIRTLFPVSMGPLQPVLLLVLVCAVVVTAATPVWSRPKILVDAEWLESRIDDPDVVVLEVRYHPHRHYTIGHIPGAVEVDWTRDLNHQIRRDYLDKAGFEALASKIGITKDTTVIFYGDKNNWWAAYAL